jgi:hypothetical protein
MKSLLVSIVVAVSLALVACTHGLMGEGESCGGAEDKCGDNLTCQPIQGTNSNYCCPTPASASNYLNCHAH